MIASNTDYPCDTEELIPVDVLAGAVRLTAGVQLGFLPDGADRATIVWTAPVTIGSRWGIWYDGSLPPGDYEIWAKATVGIEHPVIRCGTIALY